MAINAPALPALDLSTTQPRPFIRINSLDYDVRVLDDFTALELRQLDRVLPRLASLTSKFELGLADDAECQELSTLLAAFIPLVFVAPMEIIGTLGDASRVNIFKVFMQLLPPRLGTARASREAQTSESLPGMKPSLGSNASTAATSSRGRRRFPSENSSDSSRRSIN